MVTGFYKGQKKKDYRSIIVCYYTTHSLSRELFHVRPTIFFFFSLFSLVIQTKEHTNFLFIFSFPNFFSYFLSTQITIGVSKPIYTKTNKPQAHQKPTTTSNAKKLQDKKQKQGTRCKKAKNPILGEGNFQRWVARVSVDAEFWEFFLI